jgi:hypothetical protein
MVKSLDPNFKKALNQPNLTFCWCWLITRLDGLMVGFTSIDLELAIASVVYRPFTGFEPGAAQWSQGLDKTDSQTLAGILDLPASFESSRTNPLKFIELPRGYIAEIKSNNLGYEIKVKDELSLLDRSIGTNTSMTCRCNLGDDRCRVNLTPFTWQVTVTEAESRRNFKILGNFPDNYFDRGRLKFTSGNNAQIHRDIGFHVGSSLILYEPLPFEINVGDTLTVISGCVKTELACVVKFRNFANFQGEPDIPTTDLAINTPSG